MLLQFVWIIDGLGNVFYVNWVFIDYIGFIGEGSYEEIWEVIVYGEEKLLIC